MAYVADYISQQTDGWFRLDNQPSDYLQLLDGGFWTSLATMFNISGSIVGIGDTTGNFNYSAFNIYRTSAIFPVLRQGSTYRTDEVPIAALDFTGFDPDKIINITPHYLDIYENTNDFYEVEQISQGSGLFFPIKHYPYYSGINYLVTDIKTNLQNGVLLFYQYELQFDAYIEVGIDSLKIYKNNSTLINPTDFLIQFSDDLLTSSGRYTSTNWSLQTLSQNVTKRVRVLLPLSFNNKDDFYTIQYVKNIKGAFINQIELLELTPLYDYTDYTITSNGLTPTIDTRLSSSSQISYYITKDPEFQYNTIDIDVISDSQIQKNSWSLRLNSFDILTNSGLVNGSQSSYYKLDNVYENGFILLDSIKPDSIINNVIKLKQVPIYVSGYIYPDYTITNYDPSNINSNDSSGNFTITVNNSVANNIKITSIDRKKGYLFLDTPLKDTDEVELRFWVDTSEYVHVTNMELNPKLFGTTPDLFNMETYKDNGFGIAMIPYTQPSGQYLYIYDLGDSSQTITSITPTGIAPSTIPWDDTYITLAEVYMNKLTTDLVNMTDARRTGGGVDFTQDIMYFYKEYPHQTEWYTSRGYYGGEPLAHNSLVIINIPSDVFYGEQNKWISYYLDQASGDPSGRDLGIKKFNFYIDQVIRRYISAGTAYAIMPVNPDGSFGTIYNVDNKS